MRAARIHDYGGVEVLRIDHVAVPQPRAGEVLVRIAASTVNPIDCKLRSGAVKGRMPLSFPAILGCDLAGTVVALGEQAQRFAVGDEVYGFCGVQRDGTNAEFIALPERHCAFRPRSITLEESAAVPLGALTAHIALFEDAGLRAGQRVLIHAAAGGVGSMAVQLAKRAGAIVYATGSAGSAGLIESLGADVVIDYRCERFEEIARDMDVVLDSIGFATGAQSWQCLKPGGFMSCIVTPPDAASMERYGCRGVRTNGRPDGALLAGFAAMIDAGQLRPVIARVMPLEQIQEAHRLCETGHVHGRIVLRLAA